MAGYEPGNPYCTAARAALDALVNRIQDLRIEVPDSMVTTTSPEPAAESQSWNLKFRREASDNPTGTSGDFPK
jgi:hypothetical protein